MFAGVLAGAGSTVMAAVSESEEKDNSEDIVSEPEYKKFSDLNGKCVSMITGAPFEELVKSKIPEVGKITY